MTSKRLLTAIATFVVCASAGVAIAETGPSAGGSAADEPRSRPAELRSELANDCFLLATARDRAVIGPDGNGYRIEASTAGAATAFYLEPTIGRSFMLQDAGGRLIAGAAGREVVRGNEPGPAAEWRIRDVGPSAFGLRSLADNRRLAVDRDSGALFSTRKREGARVRFELIPAPDCARFPEAKVGARGRTFSGTNPDGTVFGYADAHMHITANLRAGGKVISGESFARYGIDEALGHDADNHGPDGSLDITGNLLRDGLPVGTHDTDGWPTFAGWPVHDTMTHQQAYYRWVERAWKAGLRLLVAQTVEDEALCELQPTKSHSCDEMDTVKLAIRQLRNLERYVDAQHGGRGRGWFRLVESPRQARNVIEDGKLAVVIGMETSSPFRCSEFEGEPQCTRAQMDSVLEQMHGLGVRSVFVAHWVDNGYGGAALQSGAQGDFIDTFQLSTTGHPFATEPCGAADEADGECNSKGLTALGRYLIRRMMDRRMLIEVDHLSQKARQTVFAIAERRDYPLVSSHTNTGGEWTPGHLARLHGVGGIATATAEDAPAMIDKILELGRYGGEKLRPIAMATDTGGFASLPGPPEQARLEYPFTSYDGKVRFVRQRSGERVYDLNEDGVAHYGLFADLIADMQTRPGGPAALRSLFSSAEAYLRMWEATHPLGRPGRKGSPSG